LNTTIKKWKNFTNELEQTLLEIKAKAETFNAQQFTSTRLKTQGKK
jgi:hypothetical protein